MILRKLIPCLDSCLNSDEPLSYHTYSFCCRIIRMFNKSTVEIFSETPSVTEMFIKLMKCCKKPPNSNYPSFQIVAFNQVKLTLVFSIVALAV